MKLRFALPAVVMLALCLVATPAHADDSVEQMLKELGSSTVYVEPGTPGTTDQTEATLASELRSDDGIILVMIPDSDEPITQIAKQIDDATGNDSIIGLAVGDEVLGYSSVLPQGVAANEMQRSDNISTSTVEALETFARRTHTYESQNPDLFNPPEAPHGGLTQDGTTLWPYVLVGIVMAGVIALAAIRRRLEPSAIQAVRFRETPDSVRDKVNDVLELRSKIRDHDIVNALTNTGRYIEAYFRNAQRQPNGEFRATKDIRTYLPKLASVVERYIKVQNEPEFHRQATERLSEYSQAIRSFERFMLEQVRSANADLEFDTLQAADILNASELRSIRPSESE